MADTSQGTYAPPAIGGTGTQWTSNAGPGLQRLQGIQGNPNLQGMPGLQGLQYAGAGQAQANTGLSAPQEAGYLLGQQGLAGLSPQLQQILGMSGQMGGLTNQAMGQIQPFYNQQAQMGQGMQNMGYGMLDPGMAMQLQAMQGMGGVTGALNPQMQSLVDTQRNAAMQQAQNAAYQGLDTNMSRLQARMSGQGLGESSVASRGQSDLMNAAAQQAEQGRLQAQQQSVQQEMALRQLLQAQLGQQGQMGQGLMQQGSQLAGQGMGVLGQYGGAAGTQAQMGLLGNQQSMQNQLYQQQFGNQMNILGTAMGQPQQQQGMSTLGKTLGGAGAGAAAGTAINPGWGTAIGAGIGALGGALS